MKKQITEIVFVVDESGSMQALREDTVGGVNSVLTEQKEMKNEDTVYLSTVFFNTHSRVAHDRILLREAPLLTKADYKPYGCTALLDAVGAAIKHIATVHKYAREEDRPQKTLFVIVTDGMENSSRRFSYSEVKSLIEEKEEKGWEFVFLGANIDSARTAASIGIRKERAMDWQADEAGEERMFCVPFCILAG